MHCVGAGLQGLRSVRRDERQDWGSPAVGSVAWSGDHATTEFLYTCPWIPACAGMTERAVLVFWHLWIPAFAGMAERAILVFWPFWKAAFVGMTVVAVAG